MWRLGPAASIRLVSVSVQSVTSARSSIPQNRANSIEVRRSSGRIPSARQAQLPTSPSGDTTISGYRNPASFQ
jgi:hypothetical protein